MLPEPLQDFLALELELETRLNQADAVAEIFRLKVASGAVLSNTLDALRLELTYHSNAIEGNTLTLRETQLVLEGKSPGSDKDMREVYEARNHDRALREVEQWLSRGMALSEQSVLALHAITLADIDPRGAGHYRSERVRIAGTGFIPPGSQKFNELMPIALERASRSSGHPVLRAVELHYNFVAIHPFSDGNGRTARLLMNHVLQSSGYPPTIIQVEQRSAYLAALDQANRGSLGDFARLILDSMAATAQRFFLD